MEKYSVEPYLGMYYRIPEMPEVKMLAEIGKYPNLENKVLRVGLKWSWEVLAQIYRVILSVCGYITGVAIQASGPREFQYLRAAYLVSSCFISMATDASGVNNDTFVLVTMRNGSCVYGRQFRCMALTGAPAPQMDLIESLVEGDSGDTGEMINFISTYRLNRSFSFSHCLLDGERLLAESTYPIGSCIVIRDQSLNRLIALFNNWKKADYESIGRAHGIQWHSRLLKAELVPVIRICVQGKSISEAKHP
ncbi:hypothetical protein OE88DRAFT_1642573 [Heliocybe sulcata]|uniref:Uncharacterized protein n=1 Tax=Heliocybe sulcata TaxID=5364 RepID=A0A5C3N985_9AGAM|nr:hypothetical protein OE88DRAFT_1642573 [Heliocybe sulcata]